jgi:hypothetical protein
LYYGRSQYDFKEGSLMFTAPGQVIGPVQEVKVDEGWESKWGRSLLCGTESSISEIAYELGFEHPSHFTKIFKAKTGKSPSEYRNVN